jgi:hypothetical protein
MPPDVFRTFARIAMPWNTPAAEPLGSVLARRPWTSIPGGAATVASKMMFFCPFILADSPSTPLVGALSFDPAFNWFLLILLGAAVGAMVFYLYREQQKIAPRRIVHWLTAIRIALVVLIMLLLLRPVRQWASTHNTGGSLWIVLDQSLSMKQTDPQSSRIEQLRWADALGYLRADLRTSRLDHLAAKLSALRAELEHLQANGDSSADNSIVAGVKSWLDQLNDLAVEFDKDPQAHSSDAAPAIDDLRRIAKALSGSLTMPEQLPFHATLTSLASDIAKSKAAADRVDGELLSRSASDPQLQQAIAKVAAMRRADLALAALTGDTSHAPRTLAQVLAAQDTRVVTFAGGQQQVDTSDKSNLATLLKSAGEPIGGSTNIADALKFVGDQIANSDQANVLLVSDGRANDGGDLIEPARQLAAHGARVFTLAVGSRQRVCDAAVESIDAPDWIYKDDTLRASALLRLDGLKDKPVTVELLQRTQTIDTKTITPSSNQKTQVVTFSDKPPEAGMYDYEVHIREMPGEAVKENNRQSFRVSVKNDKLHVLVVDDQPRWEFRYLANYLSRDNRVQLQTVLLEPARIADVQTPAPIKALATNTSTVEAQILPQTKEDWSGFDLLVLGDVPAESLSTQMQQNIVAAVRDRGATLIIIAGQLNMPGRYAGTPLADLLPVYLNANWTATSLAEQLHDGFHPMIAPEGAKSILSQLGLDDASNTELWSAIPPWYWHSEQTQAKLSANVLWSIADAKMEAGAAPAAAANVNSMEAARQRALLCTMSVGLGRVMYLASDSTWRLRQVNGQDLHERFWGQVIRWVVGSDLPAGGKFVRFGTNKPKYADGEPIHVAARVLKEDLTPLTGQHFKVIARMSGDQKIVHDAEMEDSPQTPGFYHATLPNLPPGQLQLTLAGPEVEQLLASDTAEAARKLNIQVLADANLEMQNINADHEAMQQIAQAGGGIALDAPYADVMADHLPDLRHDQTTIEQIGMFTDPKDPWTHKAHWAFLLVFVSLITTEWVLRKAGGLV